eukprot:TRINITY_DN191_c0_g1_i1.p1 TRINITY_DN191_c0_g1~~TRINITY_DN191_c0_g1_i1.p1  ORF type:complete len:480 (-),score=81.96 TRINITY_DN191_c0_g1_i1:248-1687(-)
MLAASIPTPIPVEARPEACCILSDGRRIGGQKSAHARESRPRVFQSSAGQRFRLRTASASAAGSSHRGSNVIRLPCTRASVLLKKSGCAMGGRRGQCYTRKGSVPCALRRRSMTSMSGGSGLTTRPEDDTAAESQEDIRVLIDTSKLEIAGQLEVINNNGSITTDNVETPVQLETDKNGVERVAFRAEGYSYWKWRGHKIHYVVQGEGQPLLLVHGFGASAFHWRYNIPALAKKFKVYAVDMLGFGWSDKALVDYNMHLWGSQLSDFVKEVIGEPAVFVGNSVGAFTVLATASLFPEAAKAVVLINAAGQFENPKKPVTLPEDEDRDLVKKYIVTPIFRIIQRLGLLLTFNLSKQPSRVSSVLQKVYIDPTNVDDYLIESIVQPSRDPNAADVYCRVGMSAMAKSSFTTLDELLAKLNLPLLLLWGDLDPWIEPTKAERIMSLYPRAEKISVPAGHCPHDEIPEQFNAVLTQWVGSLSP